jgi:hypothetical protein
MPAKMAAPPTSSGQPAVSPNNTAPAAAPTSGSMFRNAPATGAATWLCP